MAVVYVVVECGLNADDFDQLSALTSLSSTWPVTDARQDATRTRLWLSESEIPGITHYWDHDVLRSSSLMKLGILFDREKRVRYSYHTNSREGFHRGVGCKKQLQGGDGPGPP